MGKIIKHSIIENVPFWILAGVAIAIGVTAFFIPPQGVIDPSVLKFISWMFAFTALWTVFAAMMRGIDARVTHGKTSLIVGSLENKDTMPPTTDVEEDSEDE